jgi:oxalate decarboxylase/phosphoglucose isomerase-like protein (cupin superfamily)
VHAGDIVFVPRDTWIGAENVGPEHLTLASVYSSPGYEEYLRGVSVVAGQPVTPLSQQK